MKIITWTDPATGARQELRASPRARRLKKAIEFAGEQLPAGALVPRNMAPDLMTTLIRGGYAESDDELIARLRAKDVPAGAGDVQVVEA